MIPCKVAGTSVATLSAHACSHAAPVADRLLQPTDPIAVKVNKLSSTKTQLPYDYYSLPYCRPERIVNFAENLGGWQ
jgi:transmembrane 9 superfamily protein 2/4